LTIFPVVVFADDAYDAVTAGLGRAGSEAGYTTATSFAEVVGGLINVILSVLGIVFLILLILAGFKWLTAQGDSKKTQDATKMLVNAVIGILIIIGAMALSQFIFASLETAV